jgi:hypothetical protein
VAAELYGVCSKVRSVRLEHQGADRGLIRLMVWEKPKNNGLQMSSMKVKGNPWATTLTADLLNILNHAEEAQSTNLPVKYTCPRWEVIYNKERKARPFVGAAVGVREMMLLQPLTRQVFFQRFNYALPNYGKINQNAFFKTSQITQMGMIIQDNSKETLLFYEEVLGLIRARDDVETTFESSLALREIFDLHPGEKFVVTAFDDPRSSKTDFAAARSGRLYILRFPSAIALDDGVDRAIPGCLGMSLYTYRVSSIAEYFHRVKASSAQKITEIVPNEFGEASFSFIAPDGYFWTLIESAS